MKYPIRKAIFLNVRETPPPAPGVDDIAAAVAKKLMEKNGGPEKALELVLDENKSYRERHRQDTETITALKAKVAPEGAVVLTGDQVKLWQALTDAKLTTPKSITDLLAENTELKTKVESAEMASLYTDAGEEHGYKPKMLQELLGTRGKVIELKDTKVKGEDDKETVRKRAFVRSKDKPNEAAVPLDDYVSSDLKDYAGALRVTAKGTDEGGHEWMEQHGAEHGSPVKSGAEAITKTLNQGYMTPSQRRKEAQTQQ